MNELVRDETLEQTSVEVSDKKSIALGAIIQAFFTFLSRIFGMIRDVMISHIFGAGFITDTFFIAFTIPNVLRQFFGEGAFSVAFIPIYVSTRENDGAKRARMFFRDAFGFLLLLLSIITICGVIFSKNLVVLFAYGFIDNPEQIILADTLTKWLFPYIFMISLVALFGAYLACYKRFAAMAAAPIFLNVAMILAILFGSEFFSPKVMVLVFGVLLGGVLQVILMSLALVWARQWAWPRFSLKSEAMHKLFKLLGPALFGVFVYQLNIIVLRQLASFLGNGQITYYYNADRLTQFAIGVFTVSISTAALPELSKNIAKLSNKSFHETLRFTLMMTSFVITPCAFGLMLFSYPIVSVLFVHGAFTHDDAVITAHTLKAFSPSLIAFSLSRPLTQAFYAMSDTKTPVRVGIITVILNLIIGLFFLQFQIIGLSMTLSISSSIQFFILLYLFKKRCKKQFKTKLLKPFCSHAAVSIISCGLGLWIANLVDWQHGFSVKNALLIGLLLSVVSSAYLLFGYYFKLDEARKFIDGIKTRFG
jgi:putative peptidoglycan lipid II flippase